MELDSKLKQNDLSNCQPRVMCKASCCWGHTRGHLGSTPQTKVARVSVVNNSPMISGYLWTDVHGSESHTCMSKSAFQTRTTVTRVPDSPLVQNMPSEWLQRSEQMLAKPLLSVCVCVFVLLIVGQKFRETRSGWLVSIQVTADRGKTEKNHGIYNSNLLIDWFPYTFSLVKGTEHGFLISKSCIVPLSLMVE